MGKCVYKMRRLCDHKLSFMCIYAAFMYDLRR